MRFLFLFVAGDCSLWRSLHIGGFLLLLSPLRKQRAHHILLTFDHCTQIRDLLLHGKHLLELHDPVVCCVHRSIGNDEGLDAIREPLLLGVDGRHARRGGVLNHVRQ